MASLSALLVDKFVGFNHRDVGTIVAFSLMPVVPPKAYRDNACSGLCQQNVLHGITTKCSSVSLFPRVWFVQLLPPLLPRKFRGSESNIAPKAENPILKAWNLEHQGCGQI